MKNKIKIRKAKLKDVEDIIKLTKELLNYDYKNFDKTINTKWKVQYTKEIEDAISKINSIALLALDKEKVVGYFIGRIEQTESYRSFEKIAEAQEAYIIKTYRKKNIGTLFLKEFFKWAKENKIERIKVVASAENKSAIEFYKKAGFKYHDVVLEMDLK